MIGDQSDVVSRLQRWLPQGWFPPDVGTRIYAILSGFGSLLATIFSAITYVQLQTRLATLTDGFVDLAGYDFFGGVLPRLSGEVDATYSARIRREIVRDRTTRNAIDALLFELTGHHPEITEPWRAADNFAWRGRYGWRTGHYSGRDLRYTVFIKTTHAGVFGIDTGGWRNNNAAWRVPTFVYTDPSMTTGSGLTDQQILEALNRIRAAGVTYWVWIADLPGAILITEDGLSLIDTEGGDFITI